LETVGILAGEDLFVEDERDSDLEQEWNIWNMFLGESVVELLESGASFTYVK
jgi:hypothetical protein